MATGTALRNYHTTITTANTAETVTLTGGRFQSIHVWNRGAADLFVRLDGSAAVANAAENYVIPAGKDNNFTMPSGIADVVLETPPFTTAISVVSATVSVPYSVEAV